MILRIALRQAWISYRVLIGTLAPVLVAAMAVAVEVGGVVERGVAWQILAAGLAGVAVVGAAVVGRGLAADRERGMLGWLAVRAVPRASILAAWFSAPLIGLVLGTTAAVTLARMALQPALVGSLDAAAYVAVSVAVAAAMVAAAGIGLLAGVLFGKQWAMALTVIVVGALAAGAVVGGDITAAAATAHPGSGFGLLAQTVVVPDPQALALGAAGLALVMAALLWIVAAAAFSRRDL